MSIGFLLTMLYYRYCYYQGKKRVMGGFTALMHGPIFNLVGILFIRSSRLLIDARERDGHKQTPIYKSSNNDDQ